MRTSRWLTLAGAAVAAAALSGCILPPPHDHGHGRDGGRGGDRYDNRGDRDRDGRWDRDGRPSGPPPGGGYGQRY